MFPMMLREDVLETRDIRDILDRVMDKGIVLDPADRIGMAGEEIQGEDHIVIGAFESVDKDVA